MGTEVIAGVATGDESPRPEVSRDRFPLQSPKKVKPVDQNYRLVEADLGLRKRLADTVGGRDRIAVQNRDVQSSGMAVGHERLMQVRQSRNHRTACSSATDHQHAYLPFKQLRVDAVNFHDQLLNSTLVYGSDEFL
jgi:hypothetical protein